MSIINYLHAAPWFLPARVALSLIYGLLLSLRNWMYDHHILKIYSVKTSVISVGNISTGGSGKTILVQALIDHFLSLHKRPAVLSRGYGRSSKGLVLVADEDNLKASLQDSGDEPFLIATNFPGVPIVVSENRFAGARFLEDNFAPDVIILDDGFQHRRLNRDLDILIIDFPVSQESHLLPWGSLREQVQNMARADVVIFSKKGLQDDAEKNLLFKLNNYAQDHHNNRVKIVDLKGEFGLFAGLGNPDYFFKQVEAFHLTASVKIILPDHAQYSVRQLTEIESNSCAYWITTQKDFIKLSPVFCNKHNIFFIGVKTTLPEVLLTHLKQHFK